MNQRQCNFLRFVKRRMSEQRISTKSLIVTVFGDTLAHHGQSVALTSLIDVLARMDIGGRAIRTSVNRLLREGMLQSAKIGRNSYYQFSEIGRHHSHWADRRIYDLGHSALNEDWSLVLVTPMPAPQLAAFQKGLSWLGYRPLRPGLFAHYANIGTELNQLIDDLRIEPHPVVYTAKIDNGVPHHATKQLIYDSWDLESLAKRYRAFCMAYRPIIHALRQREIGEDSSFFLRTMLIHEYRRILLKDPELPVDLLPANWPGFAAKEIAARLYRLLAHRSHVFIVGHFRHAHGAVPPAHKDWYRRFGGMEPAPPSVGAVSP